MVCAVGCGMVCAVDRGMGSAVECGMVCAVGPGTALSTGGYPLRYSLVLVPDSLRSPSFQWPSEPAEGCRTEQVSSLSDTDQVIQLRLFLLIQSI